MEYLYQTVLTNYLVSRVDRVGRESESADVEMLLNFDIYISYCFNTKKSMKIK